MNCRTPAQEWSLDRDWSYEPALEGSGLPWDAVRRWKYPNVCSKHLGPGGASHLCWNWISESIQRSLPRSQMDRDTFRLNFQLAAEKHLQVRALGTLIRLVISRKWKYRVMKVSTDEKRDNFNQFRKMNIETHQNTTFPQWRSLKALASLTYHGGYCSIASLPLCAPVFRTKASQLPPRTPGPGDSLARNFSLRHARLNIKL